MADQVFATDSFPTGNTRSSIPDKPIEPLRASFSETEKLDDEGATSFFGVAFTLLL